MPVTYRQLQAPVGVETNIPDSGAADAADALARSLSSFSRQTAGISNSMMAKAGSEAGRTAGASGKPDIKGAMAEMTAYGRAYNNSAYREYAVTAESQLEDAVLKAETEAGNDPARFTEVMKAHQEKTIKQAEPATRGLLTSMYNKRVPAAANRIQVAQAAEQKKRNREVLSEGVERSVDRIAQGMASLKAEDQLQAELEQGKLNSLIDASVRDGSITAVEADAARISTQRDITKQTVRAKFGAELESPYGNPVKFIQRLKEQNKASDALLPDEEAKLVDALMADLAEHNSLLSAQAGAGKAEQKARFDEGDRLATTKLFSGALTKGVLRQMVEDQQLDPSRATSLSGMLEQGNTSDDGRQVAHVRINLLEYTPDEIMAMPGISWKTKGDLAVKRKEEEAGWRGQPRAVEAVRRIKGALDIPEGSMVAMLNPAVGQALDASLVSWYGSMESTPPEEREAKAIEIAEKTIQSHIRSNKKVEAEKYRRMKNGYMTERGDVGKMGGKERAAYDKRLTDFDAKIRAAELEAAK